MKKIKLFLFLITIAFLYTFYLNSSPGNMRSSTFTVRYGETIRMVARNLEKRNLIRSRRLFVYSYYIFRRSHVKAGSYKVKAGMSTRSILEKVTKGVSETEWVTIPEGFHLEKIAERLEKNNITDYDQFMKYCRNRQFLRSIGINAKTAEGYLFPDTYRFPESSDARDIIRHMYSRTKEILESTGIDSVETSGMSLHSILTLASLIEKEARVAGERPYISSVFHNRLRKNMKLDCDPTVRYALKKFRRRLSRRDLKVDSPYNTYKRRGLPPTPICSPGKDAILAVLYPKSTKYFYFVAKNGGAHYFSKTLREHNRAVQYYRKGKRNGFIDNQHL